MALDFTKLVLGPCIGTFGEVNQGFPLAVYTPQEAAVFTVDGIFDENYKENVITDGQIVTVTRPVFGIKLADFPQPPKQGDRVVLRGKEYEVRESRVDGHGGCKLMLNEFVSSYEM